MKIRASKIFFFILSILILNQNGILLSKITKTLYFGFRIFDFGIVLSLYYHILGREIVVLVNEQLKPGTYEVTWDGSGFSSGIYFYKLMAGDYIESKKMILIR